MRSLPADVAWFVLKRISARLDRLRPDYEAALRQLEPFLALDHLEGPDPAVRACRAAILALRADALRGLGRTQEAIDSYQDSLQIFVWRGAAEYFAECVVKERATGLYGEALRHLDEAATSWRSTSWSARAKHTAAFYAKHLLRPHVIARYLHLRHRTRRNRALMLAATGTG